MFYPHAFLPHPHPNRRTFRIVYSNLRIIGRDSELRVSIFYHYGSDDFVKRYNSNGISSRDNICKLYNTNSRSDVASFYIFCVPTYTVIQRALFTVKFGLKQIDKQVLQITSTCKVSSTNSLLVITSNTFNYPSRSPTHAITNIIF